MNLTKRSFIAALALIAGLFTSSAFAQTNPNSTSQTALAAAITSISATSLRVNSATGAAAGSTSLVVDAEVMDIAAVNGTTLTVVRGMAGTRATTHASGAVAYIGTRPIVDTVGRYGSCTTSPNPVLVPTEGRLYTCSNSNWVSANLTTKGGFLTMSATSGGVPTAYSCGATSGSTTCANTQTGYTAHIISGVATLSAGTAVISGISPAFTSTATGACVGIDTSGASGVLSEVVISGVSSITVAGTGAGTVSWMCVGY